MSHSRSLWISVTCGKGDGRQELGATAHGSAALGGFSPHDPSWCSECNGRNGVSRLTRRLELLWSGVGPLGYAPSPPHPTSPNLRSGATCPPPHRSEMEAEMLGTRHRDTGKGRGRRRWRRRKFTAVLSACASRRVRRPPSEFHFPCGLLVWDCGHRFSSSKDEFPFMQSFFFKH